MEIRKANVKDFEKLKDIKLKSKIWERKYSKSLKPMGDVKKRYFYYLKKDLEFKHRAIFIAVEDDKVIGMILGKILDTLPITRFRKKGYISNLHVLQGHRKKRIGRKLVKELIKWFRINNIKNIELEIHFKNKPALDFYNKLGFKKYTVKMNKLL